MPFRTFLIGTGSEMTAKEYMTLAFNLILPEEKPNASLFIYEAETAYFNPKTETPDVEQTNGNLYSRVMDFLQNNPSGSFFVVEGRLRELEKILRRPEIRKLDVKTQ